jgi:steroid delta-isomerase-like uncharacterized protein
MSAEQNKSIARRWVEEGWNKHNPALVDEIYTPDVVQIDPNSPVPVESAAALKAFVGVYLTAFPDIHFKIDDLTAEGERVIWRFSATATHRGDLLGMAPTGRPITVTGMVQFDFRDSRIARVWVNHDFYGILAQLGAIPAPTQ